jgi:hypothetical protein
MLKLHGTHSYHCRVKNLKYLWPFFMYVVLDELECSAVFRLHCKARMTEKLPHRIGAVHNPDLPGKLEMYS